MPVTSPQAVLYSDEVLRPLADLLAGALALVDRVLVDARPDARNLLGLFPQAGGVIEGSDRAGRNPLVSDQARALVRLCEVIRDMADDDRDPATGEHTGMTGRALIHAFAVNPRVS
jgi:hypothetical protein